MNPFQSRQPATVRMQLPPGYGRQVSARGLTFEADESGHVTVPSDVAAELKAHIPEVVRAPMADTEYRAEIARINGQLAANDKARRVLQDARQRASCMVNAPAVAAGEVAALDVRRRNVVADWILGIGKKADVDANEAERKRAAARAADEDHARELGRLSVDELNARIEPHDQAEGALKAQRGLAARRAIRARAETAAREYRDFMNAAARAFGVLQAHAAVLADLERIGTNREDIAGGRQSFDCFQGNWVGPLPACPALEAFKGCPQEVIVPFNVAELRAFVRQVLTTDGLLA